MIDRLGKTGVSGGAVYDALVALAHELSLISRDRRAADIFRALGATVELLG